MVHFFSKRRRDGFTLVELIIVIAIIAIIAAVIFVAIDPARRLNASRNASRWQDVNAILAAIKTFQADSPTGLLPGGLQALAVSQTRMIGEQATTVASDPLCVCAGAPAALPTGGAGAAHCFISDLDTSMAAYLKTIPADPGTGTASTSRYYVHKDANSLIEVGVCDEQADGPGGTGTPPVISVAQ